MVWADILSPFSAADDVRFLCTASPSAQQMVVDSFAPNKQDSDYSALDAGQRVHTRGRLGTQEAFSKGGE